MKTKLFVLALASCLEFVASSGSAQAQLFERYRRPVDVDAPGYQPAVYGKKGPGVYDAYGRYYYGLPDYRAAMEMYGFPVQVYPDLTPRLERAHHYTGPASGYSASYGSSYANIATVDGGCAGFSSQVPAQLATRPEFHVKVPVPNAKVYFNDKLVEQDGTDRKLITPALQLGTYSYRIRATWTENGQSQTQEQKYSVQPGQVMNVAFGVPVKP